MMVDNLLPPELRTKLERLRILLGRSHTGDLVGERPSRRQGGGLEFTDYRPYEAGDDYRYIDWNLLSRLDQVFIKQFVEERDTAIHLLVDCSRSMGFGRPSKLDSGLRMAAALGFIGLRQWDRVGAGLFSDGLDRVLPLCRGRAGPLRLLTFLERAAIREATNLNRALDEFGIRHRRPGLAVVLTDLLDEGGYHRGLRGLRERGWSVLLLHLLSPEELKPGAGGAVTLIDSETGVRRDHFVDEGLLAEYRDRLDLFCREAGDFCRHYGLRYRRVDTGMKVEDQVLGVFRREGIVG